MLSQNGAYYYGDAYHQHNHDGSSGDADYNLTCCTKKKLIAAKHALDTDSVPISYVQLDDWWCVCVLPSFLLSSLFTLHAAGAVYLCIV